MAERAEDFDRLLDLLGDVRVQFWMCRERHPNVRWDGDVATCLNCGETNVTAVAPREHDDSATAVSTDATPTSRPHVGPESPRRGTDMTMDTEAGRG